MQTEPVMVYRRSWCEDSDAAVTYFRSHNIAYREIDIEQDAAGAQGVAFVTGGSQITPTLVYARQAIAFDPWQPERFAAWWECAHTPFSTQVAARQTSPG